MDRWALAGNKTIVKSQVLLVCSQTYWTPTFILYLFTPTFVHSYSVSLQCQDAHHSSSERPWGNKKILPIIHPCKSFRLYFSGVLGSLTFHQIPLTSLTLNPVLIYQPCPLKECQVSPQAPQILTGGFSLCYSPEWNCVAPSYCRLGKIFLENKTWVLPSLLKFVSFQSSTRWILPTSSRSHSPSFSAVHEAQQIQILLSTRVLSTPEGEVIWPLRSILCARSSLECLLPTLLTDNYQRKAECVSSKYNHHCAGACNHPVHTVRNRYSGKDLWLSHKLSPGLVTSSGWCSNNGHFSRRTHTPASQRWVPMDVTTSQLSMIGS